MQFKIVKKILAMIFVLVFTVGYNQICFMLVSGNDTVVVIAQEEEDESGKEDFKFQFLAASQVDFEEVVYFLYKALTPIDIDINYRGIYCQIVSPPPEV
jgi:hypothetical protein